MHLPCRSSGVPAPCTHVSSSQSDWVRCLWTLGPIRPHRLRRSKLMHSSHWRDPQPYLGWDAHLQWGHHLGFHRANQEGPPYCCHWDIWPGPSGQYGSSVIVDRALFVMPQQCCHLVSHDVICLPFNHASSRWLPAWLLNYILYSTTIKSQLTTSHAGNHSQYLRISSRTIRIHVIFFCASDRHLKLMGTSRLDFYTSFSSFWWFHFCRGLFKGSVHFIFPLKLTPIVPMDVFCALCAYSSQCSVACQLCLFQCCVSPCM